MFDHVAIRVADRAASERFYRLTLGALEIGVDGAEERRTWWNDFSIVPVAAGRLPTRHLHLAFVAPSRDHVDEFWRTGTIAGYENAGAPGERPRYTRGYYGAFLRDPDGNSAEAVHHADVRRGSHIDHLWIRVPDLDATVGFYKSLAPHLGLREGRRWEDGYQLRGAWATFSLVSDGAPPTENLHIAFPAPGRQVVDDFHRAATAAGYRDNGAPGKARDPGGYAAMVLDPAGTEVESVFREGR